jgi:outer membrane biosynthesis protein TonB
VLFAGFGFLRHPPTSQPEASLVPPEQNAPTVQKPQSDQASPSEKKPSESAKPDARHASRKPEPGREPATASLNATAAGQPQQASLRSAAQPSTGSLTSGGDQPAADAGAGVVQKAVPDVPKSASDTIQGTIRVSVKVKVDPSGNVAGSEMVVPGSSKYFARLSLESAPKWKFAPSQDSAREFLVHFEFKNSGTRAYATR